jgi:cellulose synthase/poly-beta-1,6-N-acetylglucosamine synthase-like glycosyltransferase
MGAASILVALDAAVVSGWVLFCAMLPRALRTLPRPAPWSAPGPPPKVSVVVPARDEERLLPRCLASIHAQRLPVHEVIVVDDDSADGTARVAALYGARVRTAGPRPAGWAGKPWAAHRGAVAASGEWLAFVDADAVLAPDCLGAAVGEADSGRVDLLAFLHRPDCGSTFEAILQPVFMLVLCAFLDIRRVNDPASDAAAAPGSFLLFRRAAYERMGGHASVRGAIVEDLELARSAKQRGLTLRVLTAPELISTMRPRTASQVCDGWRRVVAGGMADRPAASAAGALTLLAVFVGPCVLAPAGLTFFVLAVVHAIAGRAVRAQTKRAFGLDERWAWLQPVGAVIAAAILARASLGAVRRTGTVRWSGREYKL